MNHNPCWNPFINCGGNPQRAKLIEQARITARKKANDEKIPVAICLDFDLTPFITDAHAAINQGIKPLDIISGLPGHP
jgi:hypothetical protein